MTKSDPLQVLAAELSVQEAVLQLRQAYGESQQRFSDRVGVAIRTIARWELEKPPTVPLALEKLRSLALEIDRLDLADVFQRQLPRTDKEIRRSAAFEAIQVVMYQPEVAQRDEIVRALRRYFDAV